MLDLRANNTEYHCSQSRETQTHNLKFSSPGQGKSHLSNMRPKGKKPISSRFSLLLVSPQHRRLGDKQNSTLWQLGTLQASLMTVLPWSVTDFRYTYVTIMLFSCRRRLICAVLEKSFARLAWAIAFAPCRAVLITGIFWNKPKLHPPECHQKKKKKSTRHWKTKKLVTCLLNSCTVPELLVDRKEDECRGNIQEHAENVSSGQCVVISFNWQKLKIKEKRIQPFLFPGQSKKNPAL